MLHWKKENALDITWFQFVPNQEEVKNNLEAKKLCQKIIKLKKLEKITKMS